MTLTKHKPAGGRRQGAFSLSSFPCPASRPRVLVRRRRVLLVWCCPGAAHVRVLARKYHGRCGGGCGNCRPHHGLPACQGRPPRGGARRRRYRQRRNRLHHGPTPLSLSTTATPRSKTCSALKGRGWPPTAAPLRSGRANRARRTHRLRPCAAGRLPFSARRGHVLGIGRRVRRRPPRRPTRCGVAGPSRHGGLRAGRMPALAPVGPVPHPGILRRAGPGRGAAALLTPAPMCGGVQGSGDARVVAGSGAQARAHFGPSTHPSTIGW